MFTAVSKVLFIALMLIAFVGQTIAFNTSIACESSAAPLASNISKLAPHYDSTSMSSDDSSDDCCGIDCCTMGCACIANACSALAYVSTEIDVMNKTTVSESIDLHPFKHLQSIASLFYRPPIFTS